jgi:hypothetical protein
MKQQLGKYNMINIETLQDVEIFIATLEATNMLWHADDRASDCLRHKQLSVDQIGDLQIAMNQCINVCEEAECDVFDFYTLND